jgi:hypothetical protein
VAMQDQACDPPTGSVSVSREELPS